MLFFAGTRILRAIREGNTATLRKLLEKGADPNIRDTEGNSPLANATLNDNVSHVRLLLEAGANDQEAALELASRQGHQEIVRALLDKNVRPTSAALAKAAGNGRIETVELLIGAGAQDPDGVSIRNAAANDHFAVAKRLINKFEYDSWTLACARDVNPHGQIAKLLQQVIGHRNLLDQNEAARELRDNGPSDKVSQTVFQWLNRRRGNVLHVKYECRADGAYSIEEGAWRSEAPFVAEEGGALTLVWRFDTIRWQPVLKLPPSTYHEAQEGKVALEYRRGFGLNFDGFESNVPRKHEVNRWYIYTFSA